MVAPGSLARTPAATIAVVVEPDSPTRPARRRGRRGRRRRRRRGRRRRPWPEHPGLEVDLVGGVDRVGRVVGEGAVELAGTAARGRSGRPSKTAGTTRPPMPLAVSATTFSGRRADEVDEGADVGGVVGEEVELVRTAGRAAPAGSSPVGGHGLDVAEPGVLADGLGAGEAQLDAVVRGRVVAGGEHGGRRVEVAGGEVGDVGGRQAEVDDVEALVEHPLGEGRGQLDARRPHVAGDEHAGGAVGRRRRSGRRPRRCAGTRRRRAGRATAPGCRRP